MSGIVYFVGAGPGEPQLLTLAAKQILETAQAVLYDGLVNELILAFTPPSCSKICVGKRGNSGDWKQPQINELLVDYANRFESVVRLKGGDPSIFARTSEEIECLEAAGIQYQIIPGITAAMAVAATTGIPLTHRDWSSCVALVAGQFQSHDETIDPDESIDWQALAHFPGTLVLYMGLASASQWSKQLIAHGKPPTTPIALIRRCSWPDQETLECELGQIQEVLSKKPEFTPPVLGVIGPVVRAKGNNKWMAKRPSPNQSLFGQTVLVTSPAPQTTRLAQLLQLQGAQTILRPALDISPHNIPQVDAAIEALFETDWLVFSSRIGVQTFFDRLYELGSDPRALANTKIACVGKGTAQALRDFGLIADYMPEEGQGADALLRGWLPLATNRRVTLIKNPEGKTLLQETLLNAGCQVTAVDAYIQVPVATWEPFGFQSPLALNLKGRGGEPPQSSHPLWVTATSANIATHAHRLLCQSLGEAAKQVRWLAISKEVANRLQELGVSDAIVSEQATYESMCEALVNATAQD